MLILAIAACGKSIRDDGEGGNAVGGGAGEDFDTGGSAGATGGALNGGRAGAGIGGSGGSNTACRRYAAEYVEQSTTPPGNTSRDVRWTCSFDRPSLTMTCNVPGQIAVTTWNSIEDAVNDGRPLGNVLAASFRVSVSGNTFDCGFDFEYVRDTSNRLVAVDVSQEAGTSCTTNETAYDAWDTLGRPTHGIEDGIAGDSCRDQSVTVDYDDARRVITYTRSGGTGCSGYDSSTTYDADGIVIASTSGTQTFAYDTLFVGELCID